MDQELQNASPEAEEVTVDQEVTVDHAELDAASQPFVGQWNQLVSSTNWEKGRIIYLWRTALIDSDAPATEYSDEAWARRVGGVTGQHVGRLRRVFARFGQTYEDYTGLYWSHFQAALDWDDAEMWLEGAVQSNWSVSQMRHQRWDAMGANEQERPRDEDIVAGELDEDFEPATHEPPADQPRRLEDADLGPREEGPDFGDDQAQGRSGGSSDDAEQADAGATVYADDVSESTVEFVRPFAELGDLPDDVAEAFEAFKLAILHHKMNQWEEVACEDVLGSLEALKQLALAPAGEA